MSKERPETEYGEVGYFLKKDKRTRKYTYANWGAREWEYHFVERKLRDVGIREKSVVDVGIGLPQKGGFFEFYLESGCYLTGFDVDQRLPESTRLSERAKVFRQSAEVTGLDSKSIDVVVCISSFEHFPIQDFRRTMQEIHRILKDEGRLIATLDLTYQGRKSARWAILEKTLNDLPVEENDFPLGPDHHPLTLELFLSLIDKQFRPSNPHVRGADSPISRRVHSSRWNSLIGYVDLRKVVE